MAVRRAQPNGLWRAFRNQIVWSDDIRNRERAAYMMVYGGRGPCAKAGGTADIVVSYSSRTDENLSGIFALKEKSL